MSTHECIKQKSLIYVSSGSLRLGRTQLSVSLNFLFKTIFFRIEEPIPLKDQPFQHLKRQCLKFCYWALFCPPLQALLDLKGQRKQVSNCPLCQMELQICESLLSSPHQIAHSFFLSMAYVRKFIAIFLLKRNKLL